MSALVNLEIDRVYQLLAAKEGFTIRPSQVELTKKLAANYISQSNLVAEAPTGTGKSMCYLIAMLACHRTRAITEPFIIATATKLLQQQLFEKDIPMLVKHGLARWEEFALAKGKNNYLCLNSADQFIQAIEDESGLSYILSELAEVGADTISNMVEAYTSNEWDGDFELYRNYRLPAQSHLRVKSENCLKTACSHYDNCAYYKSTARWTTAKIIVANIDLLMMHHLAGNSLFNTVKYHLLVDEAHHLPAKAIDQNSSAFRFDSLEDSQKRLTGLRRSLQLNKTVASALLASVSYTANAATLQDAVASLTLIQTIRTYLSSHFKTKYTGVDKRHELGVQDQVPTQMLSHFSTLHALICQQCAALEAARDIVLELIKKNQSNKILVEIAQRIQEILRPIVQARTTLANWVHFSHPDYACWVEWSEDFEELTVCSAIINSGTILKSLIWANQVDSDDKVRHLGGAALLSATLRDVTGFKTILEKLGLSPSTQVHVVPHTFPYKKSTIKIPAFSATPKPAERFKYLQEVQTYLNKSISQAKGTLILCTSWSMLKEFEKMLMPVRHLLKVQGTLSIKHLVEAHKADIDRGQSSILMGVASLSEGLDLPGKYCEHVIINAIPFAVPDSPIEEKVQLTLGSNYFMKRSLPDASVKLAQMVGRLNRRETDVGVISILDVRLMNTKYGQQLVAMLPPFTVSR